MCTYLYLWHTSRKRFQGHQATGQSALKLSSPLLCPLSGQGMAPSPPKEGQHVLSSFLRCQQPLWRRGGGGKREGWGDVSLAAWRRGPVLCTRPQLHVSHPVPFLRTGTWPPLLVSPISAASSDTPNSHPRLPRWTQVCRPSSDPGRKSEGWVVLGFYFLATAFQLSFSLSEESL